jgi:hypothetical protein
MPRFMMIIKGDQPPGELPSEEMLAAMGTYNEELAKAGVLVDLAGLHPTAEGARVKFGHGERTVVEGPFTESNELVAGYWIIEAKSMAEAIEWARRVRSRSASSSSSTSSARARPWTAPGSSRRSSRRRRSDGLDPRRTSEDPSRNTWARISSAPWRVGPQPTTPRGATGVRLSRSGSRHLLCCAGHGSPGDPCRRSRTRSLVQA